MSGVNQQDEEDLSIPAFLRREAPVKQEAQSEVSMPKAKRNVVEEAEVIEEADAVEEAPAKKVAKSKKKDSSGGRTDGSPRKEGRKAPSPKDQFGFRMGSLKSQAAAMYASKGGATVEEVKGELGSTQLNLLKSLELKGYTVTRSKVKGSGNRDVTRYHLAAS